MCFARNLYGKNIRLFKKHICLQKYNFKCKHNVIFQFSTVFISLDNLLGEKHATISSFPRTKHEVILQQAPGNIYCAQETTHSLWDGDAHVSVCIATARGDNFICNYLSFCIPVKQKNTIFPLPQQHVSEATKTETEGSPSRLESCRVFAKPAFRFICLFWTAGHLL